MGSSKVQTEPAVSGWNWNIKVEIKLEQGLGPATLGWNQTGQDQQAIAVLRIVSRTSNRRLELELELNWPGRLVPLGTQ